MGNENALLLIVEDNPSQQKVMQALAENYGFNSVIVATGKEAIDAILACTTCFSAILMDWKMPDMDGLECTREIREIEGDRHTPIIAVTAYAMEGDRESCLAAGMDDYLSKPFTPDDFRRMLLRWTYNESLPNLKLLPPSRGSGGIMSNG